MVRFFSYFWEFMLARPFLYLLDDIWTRVSCYSRPSQTWFFPGNRYSCKTNLMKHLFDECFSRSRCTTNNENEWISVKMCFWFIFDQWIIRWVSSHFGLIFIYWWKIFKIFLFSGKSNNWPVLVLVWMRSEIKRFRAPQYERGHDDLRKIIP